MRWHHRSIAIATWSGKNLKIHQKWQKKLEIELVKAQFLVDWNYDAAAADRVANWLIVSRLIDWLSEWLIDWLTDGGVVNSSDIVSDVGHNSSASSHSSAIHRSQGHYWWCCKSNILFPGSSHCIRSCLPPTYSAPVHCTEQLTSLLLFLIPSQHVLWPVQKTNGKNHNCLSWRSTGANGNIW